MKSKIFLIAITVMLLLVSGAQAQAKFKVVNFIPKVFWNKFPLPTMSEWCKTRITTNDISPDEEYCSFLGHLPKGTKLQLKTVTTENGWTKLSLLAEGENEAFEVFLKSDSTANLKGSFNLAFSTKEVEDDSYSCDCYQKTKLDLIKCKGFPSKITRNGKEEIFTFDYGFIGGQCRSFDISHVRIRNGKIIEIGGIV
jgi:hypothetical protein